MHSLLHLMQRDLRLAWRRRGESYQNLLFFAMVVVLFPIAMGGSEAKLAQIAPGVLWIAALLAALLSMPALFKDDLEDGTIEQWILSRHSLIGFVWARLLAHWLLTALPLLIMAPFFALALHLPEAGLATLLLSLLLGTPALIFIGGIGSALTSGLQKNSLLLPLLMLPFYLPILIFGASAVQVAAEGWSAAGQLYILAALLVLSLVLAPFAIAAALRLSATQ